MQHSRIVAEDEWLVARKHAPTHEPPHEDREVQRKYADVNGFRMYYEIHGTGESFAKRADWLLSMTPAFLDAPMAHSQIKEQTHVERK